jgi:hypothetical protein
MLQADLETFGAGVTDKTDRDWDMRSDVNEVLRRITVVTCT